MRSPVRSLVVAAALGVGALGSLAAGAPGAVRAQEAYCPTVSAVQQLSGWGDSVTQSVAVPAGLLTVAASYEGDSNFAVWVHDVGGGAFEFGDSDLLVNEIGSYDGQSLTRIVQTATLVFEVTASGPWTLDLTVMR
ncbi:MAG: hypothetical protein ACKOWF_11480 [Chloroflexota bacterium]